MIVHMGGKLAKDIGSLLRSERQRHDFSQVTLARRARIGQANLSRLECGRGTPTTAVVERAFAALGKQLTLDLEPLDSTLDASIEAHSSLTHDQRLAVTGQFGFVERKLEGLGLDYRIDGTFAAFLHGLPVEVDALAMAITVEGAPTFAVWLGRIPNVLRWSVKHRDFIGYNRDPTSSEPPRWGTPVGEIRARILPELPPPVSIILGAKTYPVLPLTDVIAGDDQIARVAERVAHLAGGG